MWPLRDRIWQWESLPLLFGRRGPDWSALRLLTLSRVPDLADFRPYAERCSWRPLWQEFSYTTLGGMNLMMREKSMAKVKAPRAGCLASPPKSLGLTIPQTFLLRVGQLIE